MENDSNSVMLVAQENKKCPPKIEFTIVKEIFESAAKFRTKHMLDKALQLRQNRIGVDNSEHDVIDLNDSIDFKEAPKFRKKLRLKLKGSSSSSVANLNDVIVIDGDNGSQDLSDATESTDALPVSSKERIAHEGFTHLKDVASSFSKETTNVGPGGGEEVSSSVSSAVVTNEGKDNFQTCLMCGMNIGPVDYKSHNLNCLRQCFSRPDKRKVVMETESIELVKCDMCNKNITHMNSQRRAQHVNNCIDKEDATKQEEITYQQHLQAARTAVLSCPMCGKKFKVQSSRQSHLKKCAITNKMTVDQVKNLVKQQEEEHQMKLNAGILPEDFVPVKLKKQHLKQAKTSRPKSQLDEDTQLAMALSTSLAEDKNLDVAFRGLADSIGIEEQAVPNKGHGKNKKGKLADSASLFLTVSREEAMKRISDRVTRYIFPASHDVQDPVTPPFKTGKKSKSASESSPLMLQEPLLLWSKTSLNESASKSLSQPLMDVSEELRFYVRELMPPVSVNSVSAGSKLRRISNIPGRRMSGEREQCPVADKNVSNCTESPTSSQTIEVLTKLAMESDSDNVENVCINLSSLQNESTKDVDNEDCYPESSGFCKESLIKVKSDPTDTISTYVNLVNCPSFSDLVIITDRAAEIHAHRIILHARCPELLAMSTVRDGKDIIDLTTYGEESVLCMLRYIYAGEISYYTSCLAELIQLADRFSLTSLEVAVSSLNRDSTDVNDVNDASSECDNDSVTDEDGNKSEENRDRASFDDSDWLDVFQTQRRNMRLEAESIENNNCENQDNEMMEQFEEITDHYNDEVETFHAEIEKDLADGHGNYDLNESNIRTLNTDAVNMVVNSDGQIFRQQCESSYSNNENMLCGNGSEENVSVKVFQSSQERMQTFTTNLPTQKSVSETASTDLSNSVSSKYLDSKDGCKIILFANELCKKEEVKFENPETESELNESVSSMKPKETEVNDVTVGADLESTRLEINNVTVDAGLESTRVSFSGLESASFSDNSILTDPSLTADVTRNPSPCKNRRRAVSSQAVKRKRKKVSVKEFKSLVHKVLTGFSGTNTESCSQPLVELTDEDINRISIKIEQDLQTTSDPNDSVYIPNILEDTGENSNEVIITRADIMTPVKPKRRYRKKLNVKDQIKVPEKSKTDELSTSSIHSLDAASPLPQPGKILPQILAPADVNMSVPNQKSGIVKKTTHVEASSLLKTPVSDSSPTKVNTLTLIQGSGKAAVAELLKMPIKIHTRIFNSELLDTSSYSPQISEASRNDLLTPRPIYYRGSDRKPSGYNSRSYRTQSGKKNNSDRTPSGKNNNSDRTPSGYNSRSDRTPSGKNSNSDRTQSGKNSNSDRTPSGDKLPHSVSTNHRSSDVISNDNYSDRFRNCQSKDSAFISNLTDTEYSPLPSTSAENDYISGEELFTDDEDDFRSSNSETAHPKFKSPSDPSWILSTQQISCSPVLNETTAQTIRPERKPVHRNLFSLELSGNQSALSSPHPVDKSAIFSKSTKKTAEINHAQPFAVTSSETTDPDLESQMKKKVFRHSGNSYLTSPTKIVSDKNSTNEDSRLVNIFTDISVHLLNKSHHNSTDQVHSGISIQTPSFSKITNNRKTTELGKEFADSHSTVDILPSPDTFVTHPTTAATIKDTQPFTAVSTRTISTLTSTLKSQMKSILSIKTSPDKDPIRKTPHDDCLATLTASSENINSTKTHLFPSVCAGLPETSLHSNSGTVLQHIKSTDTGKIVPRNISYSKSRILKNTQNSAKTSAVQNVLPVSILSSLNKNPSPAEISKSAVPVNIIPIEHCSLPEAEKSPILRTLPAVRNILPATQPKTDLFSKQTALPTQDIKISSNMSHNATSQEAKDLSKMSDIGSNKPSPQTFSSKPTYSHQEKTSFTREPSRHERFIDLDSPLPLRQRLGLINPFSTTVIGQSGKNAGRSESGPSVTRTEAVKIAAQPVEERNTKMFEIDDDLEPIEKTGVIEHLLEDLSDESYGLKTPKQKTSGRQRNVKNTWKEPSPFTPMAPYDKMNTPELKIAASRIGVRPVGKKRMRELLKRVYHETHQYETDSDYDGTPIKHRRGHSQPSELSNRAKLSHLPIGASGVVHTKNKLATDKASIKTVNQIKKKDARLATIGNTLPQLQQNIQSRPQTLETHEKRIVGNIGACKQGTEEDHDKISCSQDSSYSDGPELPEESILHSWPEDEVLPPHLLQSNSQTVTERLVQFIISSKDIHEDILMFKPLELDVLKKRIADAGIKVNISQVMDFLDERCITFTMKNMSSRHNNRQRRARPKQSGESPKKRKTLKSTATS